MSDTPRQHPFSSDRPIVKREEDALGRSGFAKSLAGAIKSWREKDSLVIGLFGGWGQGKTSVKNLVLDFLRDACSAAPYVVEFNPWQWSGQAQIAEAFFNDIAVELGKKTNEGKNARRAAKWRQYAALLNFGEKASGGIQKAIPNILISIAFICGAGSFLEHPKARFVAMFLAIFFALSAGVLQIASGLAESLAKFFEEKCHLGRKGPAEIRTELKAMMAELTKPMLVVIDDIDRLSPTEIRLVFQLVKSNADFPNMIYLLLFQRNVVEKALEEGPERVSAVQGHDYLEKVINVAFDLPSIEQSKVDKYLGERLNTLFSGIIEADAEANRFSRIYQLYLRHFFNDLRDVKRFISSLDFHMNLLRASDTLEVNPTDLIVLEALRVFEPGVYASLPGAKSYLTSTSERTSDTQKKEIQAAFDSVVAKSSESNRESVTELLKELFPSIQHLYGGFGSSEEWYRDRRACHENIFDRYFLLRVADGDVSHADIERLLSKAGDRDALVAELKSFNQQGLLSVLLNRLEAYKRTIDVKHATAFITAFFDIGDDLPDDNGGFFGMTPDLHASRIVYWCLKQEADIHKRGSIFIEATRQTTGLYLPAAEAQSADRRLAKKEDLDKILVDEQSAEELKHICLKKIRDAAQDGSLIQKRRLQFLLYIWKEWSGNDEASQWVIRQVQTNNGLLSILVAFLSHSTSWELNSGVGKIHGWFDLKSLEAFIVADEFAKRVDALSTKNLDDKQQIAINHFRRALKRKMAGKSYNNRNMFHDDDEDA